MATQSRWVRVSTPAGHFSVPRAVFERSSGWRELTGDALDVRGRPLAPKLREDVDEPSPARKKAAKKAAAKAAAKQSPEPRVNSDAATPTPANEEKS